MMLLLSRRLFKSLGNDIFVYDVGIKKGRTSKVRPFLQLLQFSIEP